MLNPNRLPGTGRIVGFGFPNLTTCLPLLKVLTLDSLKCEMHMTDMSKATVGSTTPTNSASLGNVSATLLVLRNAGRTLLRSKRSKGVGGSRDGP